MVASMHETAPSIAPQSVDVLLEAMASHDVQVRAAAVAALSRLPLGDEDLIRVARAVLEILPDRAGVADIATVDAAVGIPVAEVRERVHRFVRADDRDVALAAAVSLARVGDPASHPSRARGRQPHRTGLYISRNLASSRDLGQDARGPHVQHLHQARHRQPPPASSPSRTHLHPPRRRLTGVGGIPDSRIPPVPIPSLHGEKQPSVHRFGAWMEEPIRPPLFDTHAYTAVPLPPTGSATTRNTGACSHRLSRRLSAVAIVLRFVTPGSRSGPSPAGQTSRDDATSSLSARIGFDVSRTLVHGLCRLWFRIEIVGGEHIPTTGAFILSPVHRSYIDTLLTMSVTRRRLRFMGKESLWDSWPLAWFLSTLGGIPLKRGTAMRATMRIAERILETGEPLAMFPEGTRGEGPVLKKFFDGPAYLASRQGVPIIPVGIGAARAMRRADRIVWPTKVVVVIGRPIWPEPGTGNQTEGDGGGRKVSRRVVRALSETLRVDLQDLFDEAQERTGTPN